jgi:actin-related protein
MDQGFYPIVIDNGSYLTKAGHSGERLPRYIIPTLVGTKLLLKVSYVSLKKGGFKEIKGGLTNK